MTTPTLPVTALAGTVAWISAGLTTVKLLAATPPKVTFVAPANPPPEMFTCVPTWPILGLKLVGYNAAPDRTRYPRGGGKQCARRALPAALAVFTATDLSAGCVL